MTKPYMKMLEVNAISTREAAELLGVSFPYLHDLIDTGKIAVLGTFGKSFILDRHQVNELKRQREEEKRRRPNDGRLK